MSSIRVGVLGGLLTLLTAGSASAAIHELQFTGQVTASNFECFELLPNCQPELKPVGTPVSFGFKLNAPDGNGSANPFGFTHSGEFYVTLMGGSFQFSGSKIASGSLWFEQMNDTFPQSLNFNFDQSGLSFRYRALFEDGSEIDERGSGRLTSYTIDGVAVPEPGTWALMISGFGLAGSMLRRRTLERRRK